MKENYQRCWRVKIQNQNDQSIKFSTYLKIKFYFFFILFQLFNQYLSDKICKPGCIKLIMYSKMMNQHQKKQQKIDRFQVKKYQANGCIQKISFMIIRPSRFLYNQKILEPRKIHRNNYHLQVFNIPFPLSVYKPDIMSYIMLYLHGNSSSRFEGYNQLKNLPKNVGLACFDFSGCGNRTQSQFISLGKRQSKDVDKAIIFLKEKGYKVAVWGRSMGSVCALLSKEAEVIIADSAFCSLKGLCKQLAQTQVPCACLCCFHCLFPCFFWLIGKDIYSKTQMYPAQMEIPQLIQQINKPRQVLFLAAKQDKMISYVHSQKLFQKFPGKNKKLILFNGTHNSDRPYEILQKIYQFAENALFPQGLLAKVEHNQSKNYLDFLRSPVFDKPSLTQPIKNKLFEDRLSIGIELQQVKSQNKQRKSSYFQNNQISDQQF